MASSIRPQYPKRCSACQLPTTSLALQLTPGALEDGVKRLLLGCRFQHSVLLCTKQMAQLHLSSTELSQVHARTPSRPQRHPRNHHQTRSQTSPCLNMQLQQASAKAPSRQLQVRRAEELLRSSLGPLSRLHHLDSPRPQSLGLAQHPSLRPRRLSQQLTHSLG